MITRNGIAVILLVIVLVLTLACQLGSSTTANTPPIATTSPQLRKLPTLIPSTPNETIQNTPAPSESYIYAHPSGAFEILVPAGWEEETSEYGSVFLSEPGGQGVVYVTVTYTGYALDGQAFSTYLDAREENFFEGFVNYQAVSREINPLQDAARAVKTLDYDGVPQYVSSVYYRSGMAVYAIDFWMEAARQVDYTDLYTLVQESFRWNADNAVGFPIYNFVWTFSDNQNLFSFEIPISWRYLFWEENGDIIDQFWAPDGLAVIQHTLIQNSSGLPYEKQAQRVLDVLKIALPEIVQNPIIDKIDRLEDGRTRFEWTDASEGWLATTIVQEYEGKLLALTGITSSGYSDVFQSTIDYGLEWYSVPAAE
jgi:hypothetical protein